MTLSPGRIVGIIVGAVAILGVGVYGPAMLLGPLPAASVTLVPAAQEVPAAVPITMPATGQAAVAVLDEVGEPTVVAVSGDGTTVPIGGVAKLVTVLATLDSLPLTGTDPGPAITIGPDDYTDYLRYRDEDSRTLQVSPGEAWSERDVVRAVLLASSNNHADTLARWAFGSVDGYVAGANGWLAEQGFTATRVADATGLSGDNVGTAEEVARLVARAASNPTLAAILDGAGTNERDERRVPDVIGHLAESGVRTVTRSYTDPAALSYAFSTTVTDAAGTTSRLVGAMLLMPDYETLDPAVLAVIESASAAAAPIDLIAKGAVYGRVTTEWGDRADLVAVTARQGAGWSAAAGEPVVKLDAFTTASAGREVGRISVPTGSGDVGSPLAVSRDIRDPGPLWRVTHPFAIIGAFAADQDRSDSAAD